MVVGLLTKDFEVYYEAINILRAMNVSFYSLEDPERIPHYVNVVLTTSEEAEKMDFPSIVVMDEDLGAAVERAVNISQGKSVYDELVIGIDPGKRPGIAVVGDRDVLNVHQAVSVSKVRPFVERALAVYAHKEVLVRIGDGAPSQRDRLINELLDLGLVVEVVDETSTSEGKDSPDIKAAIAISFSRGRRTATKKQILPTPGEIKNLQRISREESGNVTISHNLAKSVLRGELSLTQAIEIQRGRTAQ